MADIVGDMTVDQIRKEADQLSDAQKGQLASDILASMEPPAYDVPDEDVIARVRELENGEVEDISFAELKRRVGR